MLSDVRHRRGRRKRVVLAPQRLGANADDAQAHRGGRWQSARFTEESAP